MNLVKKTLLLENFLAFLNNYEILSQKTVFVTVAIVAQHTIVKQKKKYEVTQTQLSKQIDLFQI